MKALFVHNSIFQFTDNTAYSNNIPEQVWDRYLRHFDTLKVIGRARDTAEEGLNISGRYGDRITFCRFPDITFTDELFRNTYFEELAKKHIRHADAVIVRLPSVIGTLFLKMARQLNKPAAAEVVGSVWHEYWHRGDGWSRVLAPARLLQTKQAVKQLPYAMYVTEQYLQRLYPCGGTTENASNVCIRDLVPKRYFMPGSCLRITTAGTLDFYYKGYDVVIKALAQLRAKGWSNFVYNCAGEGDSRRIMELTRKYGLEDRIRIHGSLTRPRLDALLDNTDLYIQPSRTEGLPRALIEAMSRGCAALASTAGGIPELLDADCLHHPGDHRKLAAQIAAIAGNNEQLTAMSLVNLKRAADYLAERLDDRRKEFWSSFAGYCEETGQRLR